MTRFSLADRTSPCQEGERTDSGLRQRSSHNRSIAASLSDVVILSSGRTNSMCVSFLRMLYIKRLPHPSRNCKQPSSDFDPLTSNVLLWGARFLRVPTSRWLGTYFRGVGIEVRRAQPQVESLQYAPFPYVRRVPSSTIAHVSASLPTIPHGRICGVRLENSTRVPECGSDPGLSSRCLSINEEA